jgi:CBS domain containing-hemolysin-like protein
MKWSIFIAMITFGLACLFSVVSTAMLEGVSWGIGTFIVFLLILIGIIFDIMGLAAAAAEEKPFHAMASERVRGSRQAIYIIRNADRFSNFCNDVIGDISGVISGAAAALVVAKLMASVGGGEWVHTFVSVMFAGLVSACTVGGKAIGKSFAIHYAIPIVLMIGKCFDFLERRFGIRIFVKKRKSNSGKRGKRSAARSNSTT